MEYYIKLEIECCWRASIPVQGVSQLTQTHGGMAFITDIEGKEMLSITQNPR